MDTNPLKDVGADPALLDGWLDRAELARQLADVVLFQGVGFSFSYRVDNKDSDN